ncbi:MAG: hypothetical protein PHQ23_09975 [Candidatus Wallbacteria bacterium]|nr:hypothetical protein [Candidatus Wallbacteria bacterium]
MVLFFLFLFCASALTDTLHPSQNRVLEKSGFSRNLLYPMPEEKPDFFCASTIYGSSGLMTMPTARHSLTTGIRSGAAFLSWSSDPAPGITVLAGTTEISADSYERFAAYPFLNWRFQKFAELSLARVIDKQRISYLLNGFREYAYHETRAFDCMLNASYPMDVENKFFIGVLAGFLHDRTDGDSKKKGSLMLTCEILKQTFLSFNYTNEKVYSWDKIEHWQELGMETFLTPETSFSLEIKRSSGYKRYRDLIVNSGLRILMSRRAATSIINLYALDLNRSYSSGIAGVSLEFQFD